MTENRTLGAYLNEEKISSDVIFSAAHYVASRWTGFRPAEDLRRELASKAEQKALFEASLGELERNAESLERAALMVLSLAWEKPQERERVLEAFEEAKAELTLKEVALIAAILTFALWTYESDAGLRYRHDLTVRDANGAFRTETTVERDPFPIDPNALLRELIHPSDAATKPADPAPVPHEQVRQAQAALTKAGYQLRADGIEGPHTDAAVARYQHDHGLNETGRLDRATLDHLGVSEAAR
jgi:hypothetical protein